MFKSLLSSLLLVLTGMLSAQAQPQPFDQGSDSITALDSSVVVPDFSHAPSPSSEDPLASPYPIPWAWILQTQADYENSPDSGLRYYRTPSLLSPDGRYGAYARLSMRVKPNLFESSISTVLFVEDLQTGKLQMIRSQTPADGTMSIFVPVSWSKNGDRLLVRQLDGAFSTSDATDSALVWERSTRRTYTLTPQNIDYDIAILLGWNPHQTDQILFRAGFLGDEIWPVWSVNLQGTTSLSQNNPSSPQSHPQVFSWTGSQILP